MMGKIEAEEARGLADVVTVHEQALGLVDDGRTFEAHL